MITLKNLDLLSVGVAISAILILGVSVFLSNRKSITNKTFFFLSFLAIAWSIVNYANYQTDSAIVVLWVLRLVMFFAVWYCFCLFQLFFVFPKSDFKFSKNYKFILIPAVIIVSLVALSPLVMEKITELAPIGQVSTVAVGPDIALFGATVTFLIFGGFFILFKKLRQATGIEKKTNSTCINRGISNFFLTSSFQLCNRRFF